MSLFGRPESDPENPFDVLRRAGDVEGRIADWSLEVLSVALELRVAVTVNDLRRAGKSRARLRELLREEVRR